MIFGRMPIPHFLPMIQLDPHSKRGIVYMKEPSSD